MNWKQRQYCGKITPDHIGSELTLFGWVDTARDHGGILFIHLRDNSGLVQVVFNPESNPELFKTAESLRSEFVIQVTGQLQKRTEENINPHIQNGDIELHATELTILNKAETPPFIVTEKEMDEKTRYVDEDIRLKYRYIDLRRGHMQKNIQERARLIQVIRRSLEAQNFLDIETPILTKSTPEGARDYLVPSRTHEGKFFALPQSPQLFKQLLMVSGMDRYYQVVKCFRDEDLRPNRQPEFTQLDLEASFIDEEFIYQLMEDLMKQLYAHMDKDIETPFPRLTYAEAMDKYGSDKPDLRFDMQMIDVSELLKGSEYKIFNSILESGGIIKGLRIPGQAEAMSKSLLQNELAMKKIQEFGGKGMTWMKVIDGECQSNIAQFFSADQLNATKEHLGAVDNDVLIFVADTNHQLVNEVLGKMRLHIAELQGLIDTSKLAPLWVTDFPMFEEKDGHVTSMHHPFTQANGPLPNPSDKAALLALTARAYDMVINGEEIGGGSIRIHDSETQDKVFQLLGLTAEEIEAKFGFFTRAMKYGAPPHGGIALGVDRLVSLLLDTDSIREVIPFPKNRVAHCPLTDAPSAVSNKQLEELNLKITT